MTGIRLAPQSGLQKASRTRGHFMTAAAKHELPSGRKRLVAGCRARFHDLKAVEGRIVIRPGVVEGAQEITPDALGTSP